MQDLAEILRKASDLGIMLLTQPSTFLFNWERPRDGHLVVSPALVESRTLDTCANWLPQSACLFEGNEAFGLEINVLALGWRCEMLFDTCYLIEHTIYEPLKPLSFCHCDAQTALHCYLQSATS